MSHSDVPVTRILALDATLSFAEAAHQGRADVVTAVPTCGLVTGNDEKCRCPLDDDVPRMRDVGCYSVGSSLRDLDTASNEVRHDIAQTRCRVLLTSALGESLCGFTSAVHVSSTTVRLGRCQRCAHLAQGGRGSKPFGAARLADGVPARREGDARWLAHIGCQHRRETGSRSRARRSRYRSRRRAHQCADPRFEAERKRCG